MLFLLDRSLLNSELQICKQKLKEDLKLCNQLGLFCSRKVDYMVYENNNKNNEKLHTLIIIREIEYL